LFKSANDALYCRDGFPSELGCVIADSQMGQPKIITSEVYVVKSVSELELLMRANVTAMRLVRYVYSCRCMAAVNRKERLW